MVVPVALVATLAASTALSTAMQIYGTEKSTRASDLAYQYSSNYELGRMMENERYFKDYLRAHHIEHRSIKYPYRTGYEYNQSRYYQNKSHLLGNSVNRQSAYVGGISNVLNLYGRAGIVRNLGRGNNVRSSFYYSPRELYR